MGVKGSRRESTREAVPFSVVDASGTRTELTYSSPRSALEHDEVSVLDELPWFDVRAAVAQLDAPRDGFLRRGRADLGAAVGCRGDRQAARSARVAADRERNAPGVRRGVAVLLLRRRRNADLGRLQAQFDEYYQVLADNGVRVNYVEPPVPAIGAYGT